MPTKTTTPKKPWPDPKSARKRPGITERGETREIKPGVRVHKSLEAYGNDEEPLKGRAGANYAELFWRGRK